MSTVYAIPMMVETQKAPLDKHCFGDCGKISMGGSIIIDEVGPCWVCTHEECPHETGITDAIGTCEMTGDVVHIRGLKPV